jgi:putative hemolysin
MVKSFEFASVQEIHKKGGREMEQHVTALPWNPDRFSEFQKPIQEKMPAILKGIMGKLINASELGKLYQQSCALPEVQPFWDCLLRSLGVSYKVSHEDIMRIPKDGPLVVVANHPFGAIEGLVLGSFLRSVRTDVKILSNSILQPISELQDLFFYVDPFGGKDAVRRNYPPLRSAFRWLENGGVLAAFPAGEVAHIQFNCAAITDPIWKDTIARLARRLGAPVLPVFFCGVNSLLFQMLGLLHSKIRTMLLAREMLNKRDHMLEVRIGKLISPKRLKEFATDGAATQYLRDKTYLLGYREKSESVASPELQASCGTAGSFAPIAPAGDPEDLEAEILDLGSENILIERDDSIVLQAHAWEIPKLLHEIGRQREIAFRAVGEGSGKAIDVDSFDEHYEHIFIWDKQNKYVVGAYRIGRTDHLLRKSGVDGLYVNSLFRLHRSLFRRLGPALELGRAFIRQENQRDNRSLQLLWMGIARFVARHPKYRYLYGLVSISGSYSPISRQLIARFLQDNHAKSVGPFKIRPMNPPPFRHHASRIVRFYCNGIDSMDALSDLISDIEPDSKVVPVLLRHYIRLGAKVLAFNVDADFSDCLDALILVDFARVNAKILQRLMGKPASDYFLLWHDECGL